MTVCTHTHSHIHTHETYTHIIMYIIGSSRIEYLSPMTIILVPPQKLVMEVSADGEYEFIRWSKDGNAIIPSSNDSRYFAYFTEIHFIEVTSIVNTGIYEVLVQTMSEFMTPNSLQFVIIEIGITDSAC